jgi:hypothetical protein
MKRRRDDENSDGDDPMSDAEFRKIEGFDEESRAAVAVSELQLSSMYGETALITGLAT